jgi:hypothetical protein
MFAILNTYRMEKMYHTGVKDLNKINSIMNNFFNTTHGCNLTNNIGVGGGIIGHGY